LSQPWPISQSRKATASALLPLEWLKKMRDTALYAPEGPSSLSLSLTHGAYQALPEPPSGLDLSKVPFQFGDGIIAVAFRGISKAPVVVGQGIVRVDLDRLGVVRNG
jgi:hypothetical protein